MKDRVILLFPRWRNPVESDEHAGRPSITKKNQAGLTAYDDEYLSNNIKENEDEVGILFSSV